LPFAITQSHSSSSSRAASSNRESAAGEACGPLQVGIPLETFEQRCGRTHSWAEVRQCRQRQHTRVSGDHLQSQGNNCTGCNAAELLCTIIPAWLCSWLCQGTGVYCFVDEVSADLMLIRCLTQSLMLLWAPIT
jgi:hypothetical protein